LDQLVGAIRRGERLVVATGAPGAGKTTLCLALRQEADDLTFVTTIFDPRLRPEHLLARMLRDFGLIAENQAASVRAGDRDTLVSTASRFFASLRLLGARAVVVVDDAEQLSTSALDELRKLSDPSNGEPAALRIVLVGRASLDTVLKRPELQALDRAVTTRVRLTALGSDEILPYLLHRRRDRASIPDERAVEPDRPATARLTTPVIERICEQTGGIPSLVNDLAGSLLDGPAEEHAAVADTLVGGSTTTAGHRSTRRFLVPVLAVVAMTVVGVWRWSGGTSPSQSKATARVEEPAVGRGPSAQLAATPAAATARQPEAGVVAISTDREVPLAPPPVALPPGHETGFEKPVGTAGGPSLPSNAYRITVASFRSPENASDAVSMLKALQIAPGVAVIVQEKWHRVVAGPFATLDDATAAQRILASAGYADTLLSVPTRQER
jgi:type II secretory pathway predicted ATPase ExeA